MKSIQRIEARKLRQEGISIKSIAKTLQVSPGTVSLWVRDIILSKSQIEKLQSQNPIINAQINGNKTISFFRRKKRLSYQLEGKNKAKEKDLLHQAGCMLYWAEGNKHKNSLTFTNSDVNMIKLFIKFLRESFKLSDDRFKISINYYLTNGITEKDIESFWLDQLDLTEANLRKGQKYTRPRSATNAIRHHKLLYGICRLNITCSTPIIQHIYGAIQEYAGFSNDYLLD